MCEYYLPHDAIIFTSNNNIDQFKLSKVLPAYSEYQATNQRRAYPWELEIHLSGFCQLKCPCCSYSTRHRRTMISPEIIDNLFAELADTDLKFLFFSGGGDPLYWPYWGKLVESKNKYLSHIPMGISTNAANKLDDFPIDSINKYQIHIIGYDKDSYISETGVDVFDSVYRNISLLLNSNSEITLKLLINDYVLANLDKYLDFLNQFDCNNLILKLPQNFLNNNPVSHIDLVNFEQTIRNHSICSKFEKVIFNLSDNIFYQEVLLHKCNIVHSGLYCLIREDCYVYPCVASTYSEQNAIGCIKNKRLSEILSEINLNKYDRIMKDMECPIKACRHFHMNKYIQLFENGEISSSNTPPYFPLML